MKTHLFRPGEKITMCGIELKSMSTTNPDEITCQRCFAAYSFAVDWYWHMRDLPVPAGARWSTRESPLPGMFLIMLRKGTNGELTPILSIS